MSQDEVLREITKVLSKERLVPYAKDSSTASQVLLKYKLNVLLCESMYPSLHYLEICLRNQINQTFKKLFTVDWLIQISKKLYLSDKTKNDIAKIKNKFLDSKKYSPKHEDILSQMTFGFWCSFFSKKYDSDIWHKKHAIAYTFPNLPRRNRKSTIINNALIKIKTLRNRIAHHEPVWNRVNFVKTSHMHCHQLVGACSSAALSLLKSVDRFPSVVENEIFRKEDCFLQEVQ